MLHASEHFVSVFPFFPQSFFCFNFSFAEVQIFLARKCSKMPEVATAVSSGNYFEGEI